MSDFDDEVNPNHYRAHASGVECIDITEQLNFNLGSAIKYIWRCNLKHAHPQTDLNKAVWYINRELLRLEKLEESTNE